MPDLNPESLSGLKVTELKVELKKRGLSTAGLKQVLVNRLRDQLLSEHPVATAPEVNDEPEGPDKTDESPPAEVPEPPLAPSDVAEPVPMQVDRTLPSAPSAAPDENEASEPTPAAEPSSTETVEDTSRPQTSPPPPEIEPPVDKASTSSSTSPTDSTAQPDASHIETNDRADEHHAPIAMEVAGEPIPDTKPALPVAGGAIEEPAAIKAAPIMDDMAMADSDPSAPLPSDIPSVNVVTEVRDSTDPIDSLKRKRRSSSPPPSPNATTVVEDPTSPIQKKQKPEPTSPAPQRRDARFKGLFNDRGHGGEDLAQPAVPDDDEEPVSPAIHHATRALYVRNFIRPLNGDALRNHIATLASRDSEPAVIETFFIDSIKSHALIVFGNTAAATRVRVGMHNKVFPNEKNRKPLWADFVPEEKVAGWIETERAGVRGTGRWEILYDTSGEEVTTELVVEGMQQQRHQQQRRVDISNAPSGPRRGSDAPHRPERRKVVMNLDELFMSTTTKPKLYYLPVDGRVAAERLAKQGRDAKGRY